jgi:hypothetical protein
MALPPQPRHGRDEMQGSLPAYLDWMQGFVRDGSRKLKLH